MSLTVRRLSAAALIVTGLGIGLFPAIASADTQGSPEDTATVPTEASSPSDTNAPLVSLAEVTCPGAQDWAAMKSYFFDLSYSINGQPFTNLMSVQGGEHIVFTGQVKTLPEGCSIPVGLASYQAPSTNNDNLSLAQQVQYDFEVVSAANPAFSIDIYAPDCYGQVDAFVGPNIPSFASNALYGDRKFGSNDGFGQGWTNYGDKACQNRIQVEKVVVDPTQTHQSESFTVEITCTDSDPTALSPLVQDLVVTPGTPASLDIDYRYDHCTVVELIGSGQTHPDSITYTVNGQVSPNGAFTIVALGGTTVVVTNRYLPPTTTTDPVTVPTTLHIPTTTTIPGSTTVPIVTTAPAPTTAPTPPTVARVVVTQAPGGVASEELPRTGSSTGPSLLIGLGLMVAGGFLLGTTKRTTVES